LNDILPYIEISKPKLRNNLNQLFAMKNSILILCLLFAGVTFGQSDLSYEQPLRAFNCKADSIVIYKVSDAVYNAPFRFLRVMQIRKLEVFDRDNVVSVAHDNKVKQVFDEFGVYAIETFEDGEASSPTFIQVDKRWNDTYSRTLRVGHDDTYYYYIQ
tara:strand:+ start:189 stop:662 length:474 start_codon:yes stop_codon:yes gene_type:complete